MSYTRVDRWEDGKNQRSYISARSLHLNLTRHGLWLRLHSDGSLVFLQLQETPSQLWVLTYGLPSFEILSNNSMKFRLDCQFISWTNASLSHDTQKSNKAGSPSEVGPWGTLSHRGTTEVVFKGEENQSKCWTEIKTWKLLLEASRNYSSKIDCHNLIGSFHMSHFSLAITFSSKCFYLFANMTACQSNSNQAKVTTCSFLHFQVVRESP